MGANLHTKKKGIIFVTENLSQTNQKIRIMTATAIKIRFVVVDTITGGEVTNPVRFESEALAQIPELEKNDKECGCFEPNTYKVERIEII